MSGTPHPTIEADGWTLVSAEDRHAAHPTTFAIPAVAQRASLTPGLAVHLLFDIETRDDGRVVDRGVDRMWVIVKACRDGRYVGVLDNDPGRAEGLRLHRGDLVWFEPRHVAAIATPPPGYVAATYGPRFFEIEPGLDGPGV